ncbi:MAG: S-layer homology domain-containing protein [Acidaminococcaceae bacterium]|nr:S-layer homology domain-containing protein [Acidaminococcaceae bacterium]
MKKSLLVAMAMAMGVTTSALAANPFSDVPQGHWAYDAVAQLTNSGVVDGYGVTFGGDKLMTRYEMAQIVAKAMAKGANCDKLAAEFADELDSLGVKVAKLEKRMDNVKITGNIRFSYRDTGGNYINPVNREKRSTGHGFRYNRLRSRFWVNGQINDNWQYTGMLEQNRYMTDATKSYDDIKLMRAWLNGRIGGVKVEAGRCYFLQMSMIDGEGDGFKASYNFNGLNLMGWVLRNPAVLHHGSNIAKNGVKDDPCEDGDRLYMVKAEKSFGKLDTYLAYWKSDCQVGTEIWDVCLAYPVAKNLRLTGEYFHGKGDLIEAGKSDSNGYEIKLQYGQAKAAVPGSWSVHTVYSNRPFSTLMSQSTFAGYAVEPLTTNGAEVSGEGDGFKGWEVGANYTLAKNMVAGLKYFDYETRKDSGGHARTLWGEVTISF